MSSSLINRDPNARLGMRIRMEEMGPDEENPVDEGLEGTIDKIDDIGTLHVKWDDGRYIGVIPNVDKYVLLPSLEDQIDFDIFESSIKPDTTNSDFKPILKKFDKAKINPSKMKAFESEEDLEETMTAGVGGGLAGASGYSYVQPLSRVVKKKKKKKLEESTSTSSIQSTVDFVVNNLLGWGTKKDLSPVWPSPNKKNDNGEIEDWWWQKIPTYNGGVITDPYAKTDDVWNDDILDADVNNDMTQFQKDVYKNEKKYKQVVITTNKGFDLNIDPPNDSWKMSLQKGVKLKNDKNYDSLSKYRNRSYNRSIKKEEIELFVDDLLLEVKKKSEKRIHTKKWDRCVKAVEEKNKENNTDYNPYAVCQSSIGYEGSILKPHRRMDEEEEELDETTTFGSVFPSGNFPVGPAFAAKKGQWRPSKKPLWKGGKIVQKFNSHGIFNESEEEKSIFTEINKVKWVKGAKYVKIKDKCAKYNNQPWCSQGAIDNPLELSDYTMDIVNEMSKKLGLSEEYIINKIMSKLNEK